MAAACLGVACSVDESTVTPTPTPTPTAQPTAQPTPQPTPTSTPSPTGGESIPVPNPGFEATGSWSGLKRRTYEYFAPPEGEAYAMAHRRDPPLEITLADTIKGNATYTLTVWARSVFDDAHVQELLRAGDDYPPVVKAKASARIELRAGNTLLGSQSTVVSPKALKGAAASVPNDDGGNIWVDGQFRHAFADNHLVQPLSSDPIDDPWTLADDNDAYRAATDDQGAVAPVMSVDDRRLFYTTAFIAEDANEVRVTPLTPPSGAHYDWNAAEAVLQSRDSIVLDSGGRPSDPITFDQHLWFDAEQQRLWMSWGGATVYVSEMDPVTGRLGTDPGTTNFADAAVGTHTRVARWSGDEWTGAPEPGSDYFEGPALLQNDGFWYLFASYSNLGTRYTIRMGRSQSPEGPFQDKRGRLMTEFDSSDNEFGNSFFLGDDTDQLVPGHPHFWKEGEDTYVGYDYRTRKAAPGEPEPRDILGIRRVYFVDGWPTIWVPVDVTVQVPQGSAHAGRPLTIRLYNDGEGGSVTAFDRVTLARR